MKGYASTTMLTADAQKIRDQVALMVAALPESDTLRCHELARAVGRIFRLPVVDGKYGRVEHSWCLIGRAILDVYCPGRVPMVQLIDPFWGLPDWDAYRMEDDRDDIDDALVEKLAASLCLLAGTELILAVNRGQ